MKILLLLITLLAVAVLCVKFVARWIGAGRTGTGWILFSFLVEGCLSQAIDHMTASALLGFAISLLGGGAINAWALSTTFKKGLLIGLASGLLIVIAVVLIIPAFGVQSTPS